MYVAASNPEPMIGGNQSDKRVARWLLAGVLMVIIQIALGGITRLTGSGLSITEWEVVTGLLPPLSETGWFAEFEKYKGTPQYQLLNSDFSIGDFKFIFFWEWFHRLWARLLGLVFAAGFVFFLVKGSFRRSMIMPLVILFLLGGLQGFVGWIMVASGLVGDAVYVKPTRLALHFVFALGLLSYTFWFYLKLTVRPIQVKAASKIYPVIIALLVLMIVQLLYGALMAGHKAASAAATWPDINGSVFHPAGLYKTGHGWLNFIDNKIMVHFIHRGAAYLILLSGIWLTFQLSKLVPHQSQLYKARFLPLGVIILQVFLGIFSVLSSTGIVSNHWGPFEWMAQLHQLTGMALLLVMVYLIYLTKGGKMASLAAV
jgi:cytochrome c oxidase assembly protein subunit 15